jgi:hypothetical protein
MERTNGFSNGLKVGYEENENQNRATFGKVTNDVINRSHLSFDLV